MYNNKGLKSFSKIFFFILVVKKKKNEVYYKINYYE